MPAVSLFQACSSKKTIQPIHADNSASADTGIVPVASTDPQTCDDFIQCATLYACLNE